MGEHAVVPVTCSKGTGRPDSSVVAEWRRQHQQSHHIARAHLGRRQRVVGPPVWACGYCVSPKSRDATNLRESIQKHQEAKTRHT